MIDKTGEIAGGNNTHRLRADTNWLVVKGDVSSTSATELLQLEKSIKEGETAAAFKFGQK